MKNISSLEIAWISQIILAFELCFISFSRLIVVVLNVAMRVWRLQHVRQGQQMKVKQYSTRVQNVGEYIPEL